jgi:hypothetical protein
MTDLDPEFNSFDDEFDGDRMQSRASRNEAPRLFLVAYTIGWSSLIMLLFIGLPAIIDFPSSTGNFFPQVTDKEILRIVQPLLSLPAFVVTYLSPIHWIIVTKGYDFVLSLVVASNAFVFLFGVVLFCEFDGAHLTANLCARVLEGEGVQATNSDYELFHDYLEHRVFHYLFLIGACLMHGATMHLHSLVDDSAYELRSACDRVAVVASGILLALIVIGVAIDFPFGVLVAVVFTGVYCIFWAVRIALHHFTAIRVPSYCYRNTVWQISNIAALLALIATSVYAGVTGGSHFIAAYDP